MTQNKLQLAVMLGSARDGRFCDTVADWAVSAITVDGRFTPDVIDPRSLDLTAWRGDRKGPLAEALRARLAQAEACLVVTPEYNHGYPAALKALIDLTARELQAKPVAFVSYGGLSGGLRAVEQLRPVFAELHAVTLRDTVSLAAAWRQFDAAGALIEPEAPSQALATLLNRLAWWAESLRQARCEKPYSEAAA